MQHLFANRAGQLQISLIAYAAEGVDPDRVQRVFAEIAQHRPDAIMVHGRADLTATIS